MPVWIQRYAFSKDELKYTKDVYPSNILKSVKQIKMYATILNCRQVYKVYCFSFSQIHLSK